MTTSMALTRGSQTRGADVTTGKKQLLVVVLFLLDHLVHVLHHPDSRAKLRTVLTKEPHNFRPSQNRSLAEFVRKPNNKSRQC